MKKNIAIAKNLAHARVLSKSHQHFESVVQNTYTNGAKLLAAADEFARMAECNPDEIYRVAKRLEAHVRKFAERVERRRQVLHLAVMFYTHDKEITAWLDELRAEASQDEQQIEAPANVELCEAALEQAVTSKEALLEAINNTICEGNTLLGIVNEHIREHHEQDPTGQEPPQQPGSVDALNSNSVANLKTSAAAIQSIIEKLRRARPEADELAKNRKLKYEMCLQLRLYEREALSLCNQFEQWTEEIDGTQRKPHKPTDVDGAERQLQIHNDKYARIQQAAYDFIQRGQELAQVIT